MDDGGSVDLAGRHLVVGLPCYTGVVPQALMDALILSIGELRKHGVTLTIASRTGSGIIDKVRDEIIHGFLTRTDGTDLLFLDDDIVFQPDDVLRLMAWTTKRDVVVGPYCTKEDRPSFLYGLHGDEAGKVVQDEDGLVRIKTAPAGFMMWRRRALERMREHYQELKYHPHRGEFKGETVTALCMMFLEEQPDGKRARIGEDVALCKRWTAIGGEIWLDTSIELGHVGRKEYRKSYAEWLKERVEKRPPVSEVKACKHGLFRWMREDSFIGKSMDLYGEWAEAELDTLLPLLNPGDVVFDVGANIGTHTIPMAQKVGPFGRVYAFEPQREICNLLEKNIEANGLERKAVAMMFGCSDKRGEVWLSAIDYSKPGNFGSLSVEDMAGRDYAGHLLTLDDFAEPLRRRIRMIKIDVEGMEFAVLRGARDTIRRDRPVLFVENNTAERAQEVIDAIRSVALDYVLFWHVAPYFNRNNWFRNEANVFGKYRPEANMLAVPTEMTDRIKNEDPSLIPFSEELSDWKKAHEAWIAVKRLMEAA